MKNYDLKTLKKLCHIEKEADIKPLSALQSPGSHCPLFGAVMTATAIEDLAVVVAGTEECTWYSRNLTSMKQGRNENLFSLVVSKNDLTFGCQKKLEESIMKIDELYKPKALLIVTTCVLELIGEDFESIAESMQNRVKAELMVVRTNHFKCSSQTTGMEDTLDALSVLMKAPGSVEVKSVNFLGAMNPYVENSELYRLLTKQGIKINSVVPAGGSVDEIQSLPEAAVNIVTDRTALKLAETLQSDFNMEYIRFDNTIDPEGLKEAYVNLAGILEINLSREVGELYNSAKSKLEAAEKKLKGKTFLWGRSKMPAFKGSAFLCSLGMRPLMIETSELHESDMAYLDAIRQSGADPYVSRVSIPAPFHEALAELKPDFFISHEYFGDSGRMKQLNFDHMGGGTGFEALNEMTDSLVPLSSHNRFSMKDRLMMKMSGKGPEKSSRTPEMMMQKINQNPEMMRMFQENPGMMQQMKENPEKMREMKDKMRGRR